MKETLRTSVIPLFIFTKIKFKGDYDSFEKTRGERYLQQMRDYEAQKAYRDHIQGKQVYSILNDTFLNLVLSSG